MQGFMITLGSMSVQAGVIIVIALVLRKVFEKLHIGKKYMMLFWLIPFFCLLCPWKFSAPVGFWRMAPLDVAREEMEIRQEAEVLPDSGNKSPSGQNASKQEGTQESTLLGNTTGKNQNAAAGTGGKQNAANRNQTPASTKGEQSAKAEKSRILSWFASGSVAVWILGGIWLLGILTLLFGNIVRYVKLKGRLLCSIKIEKQVYIGDEIGSPIVVGVFRPKIYLPSGLPEEYRTYVLAHERTHIRRWDMFFKMAAYVITCIHWFNPLVWYGFYLFGKDMEMACDEETVRKLGMEEREAYAKALLDIAEGTALKNKIIFVAPMGFEEGNVKSRIKHIMKYRKTFRILSVCALALSILAGCLFMVKAGTKEDSGEKDLGSVFDSNFLYRNGWEMEWLLKNMEKEAGIFPFTSAEVVLYETMADITHDGTDDLLRVVAYMDIEAFMDAKKPVSAQEAVKYASGGAEVRLYQGLGDGTFETEPCYESENVSQSHAGNGTLCLSRKDGQDYLLSSSAYERQGWADYDFQACYVDEQEGIVIDNYGAVSFRTDMDPERTFAEEYQHSREEKVPEFRERISPYIEDAEILISFDVRTEPEALYSTKEQVRQASEYFNMVWERKDIVY